MKRKKMSIFIYLMIFLINSQFAQSIGDRWYYSYNSPSANGYILLKYTHDTIISGVNYNAISKTRFTYSYPGIYDSNQLTNEYLRWTIDSVFRLIRNKETFLFNFNAHVGDTLRTKTNEIFASCDSLGTMRIDSIGTILIGSVLKRWIAVSPISGTIVSLSGKIIEGIGPIDGYFFPEYIGCIADANEGGPFRCILANWTVIYSSGISPNCDYINNVEEIKNESIKIFPNPFNELFSIEFTNNIINNEKIDIKIYDLIGKPLLSVSSVVKNNKLSFSLPDYFAGILICEIKILGKTQIFKLIKVQK